MVENAITDGKRIAQLLSSELTGLQRGPLSSVTVVQAAPDAEPSPEGTVAYGIAFDGERIGQVRMFESGVDVEIFVADAATRAYAADAGFVVETADSGVCVHVERGAAVKRAVDVLAESLA
ncbi:hypothetical protein VB773_09820 [Haloarculaceae archaeon H-GB2-1]|nr:hypothetical protein [Haloarculaceae archaeon H-GB1-1]MEA5386329.1 hypothetical protein [Haloarculaceae archaeon H-GB11]MEA5407831.1 hypothetical protein [Haloarculaceae archaeon H-GB2-1]